MPDWELEPPPRPQPGATPERAAAAAGPLDAGRPTEAASALAYAPHFDERGRPRKGSAWEATAALPAEQLAAHLERANLAVVRRPPRSPHCT